MSVQIINLRTKQPYDFRCDRQSPVGNPYFMHNESERDLVCEKYLKLFDRIMHDASANKEFRDFINRIVTFHAEHGHVTLACWCSPKRCHCETIKEWILNPW